MTASEVLQRITAALESSGVAYMLTGSLASAHYGVPRSTLDIDVVISATAEQLRAFVSSLPAGLYYADVDAALDAHRRESLFNVIDLATGWKIDFIIRKFRTFSQEEFARRRRITFQGIPLFVASTEDVIIAKLEWSKRGQSSRQIDDVAAIFKLRWTALDMDYLNRWITELALSHEWRDAKRKAEIPD